MAFNIPGGNGDPLGAVKKGSQSGIAKLAGQDGGALTETGAKLELSIGNIVVAYANHVEYKETLDTIPIQGIDNLQIDEYAENSVTVNFICSMFRVKNQACVKNGWMPKIGKLLERPELVAVVRGLVSNVVLLTVTGLKCVDRSGYFDARGSWVETLVFVGKKLYDESGE